MRIVILNVELESRDTSSSVFISASKQKSTRCCERKCRYLEEHPYHWIGIKASVVAVSYSTRLLSTTTITERTRHPTLVRLAARKKNMLRATQELGRRDSLKLA